MDDDVSDPSNSILSKMMNQYYEGDVPTSSESGKTFPSTFVQKYMVNNCKYMGGGLGKNEQGMSIFSIF